nr:MAG TPA: hypothetical protein [Caudoviricetes sp.]
MIFFPTIAYNKVNPRCPKAAPRRGGQASASARTGDFILLIFIFGGAQNGC